MNRKIKLLILILILHSSQGVTQTREIGGAGDFVDGDNRIWEKIEFVKSIKSV